jgi:hypothetical protein
MWTYAGVLPPKSIIIPHALDVPLPQGPYSLNFGENPTAGEKRMLAKEPSLSTIALFQLTSSQKRTLTRMFSRNLAMQLERHKVDFVRCWFQWNLFQPEIFPGKEQVYHYPLDDFVSMMHSYGINIIAVLANGYYRFLPKGLDIDRPNVYLARMVEASTQIVRHYRGKIAMWQLENEPNWWHEHFASDWRRGGIWIECSKIQRPILQALQSIVSSEDPGTPTMINLEADTSRAFSDIFFKYCDVLGLDIYPNYARASPILAPQLTKAAELRKLAGKPVMITETGYPSGPRFFGFTKERQAEYVRLTCAAARSSDQLSGLGIWRLSDTYWLSFPYQENSFGLLDRVGIPKPAWSEFLASIA